MYAIRQIIENPQEAIPIPHELRHRRMEVIFIALDPESEQDSPNLSPVDAIEAFRGKGKGGAVARLLLDRQSDREKER
jgi:hypothetical protein